MFFELLCRLKGYLTIGISGAFPERFLNLCASEGLYLWGVCRKKDSIYASLSVRAFRRIRPILPKTHCRVKIKAKRGVPFFLHRYGKRKALLLGMALFFALVGVSNAFIWTVRVDGNEKLTEEEIKFIANYCGLRQGVVKYSVNEKNFQKTALRFEPRLAWIWPEIRGTVAYVHVREKALSAPPADVKTPSDIVSSRSGRINRMTVKRGHAAVGEGDTVAEGTVLIAGDGVRAEGEVLASFWEEAEMTVRLNETEARPTGEETCWYGIRIGDFGMSFRLSFRAPYARYETVTEETPLTILGDVVLPVTVCRTVCREMTERSVTRTKDEAARMAEEELCRRFEEELMPGVTVKDKTVTVEDHGGSLSVTIVFECEEDIALTAKQEN